MLPEFQPQASKSSLIELSEPCISNGLLGIAAPEGLHNGKKEGNLILGKNNFFLSPLNLNQPSSVGKLLPAFC